MGLNFEMSLLEKDITIWSNLSSSSENLALVSNLSSIRGMKRGLKKGMWFLSRSIRSSLVIMIEWLQKSSY